MSVAKFLATGALAAQVRHYKEIAEAKVAAVVIKAVSGAIAAAFLMIALVFGSLSVFYWIGETTTPKMAALWVAGGWVLIALLVWLIGTAQARARTRRAATTTGGAGAAVPAAMGAGAHSMAQSTGDMRQSALDKGYEMGAKVNDTLASHPYRSVGAALAAGMLLAWLGRRRQPPPPRC